MKTILVDCINAFVDKDTGMFQEMYELLEQYDNDKIVLTGANSEQREKFQLNNLPYPLFTLEHNPEKEDPQYFQSFLEEFNLNSDEVIYFEHDIDAVKSAQSLGIETYHYDMNIKDLVSLKSFLDSNLSQ